MRVCVESYGCTMNQGEGLDLMKSLGRLYKVVNDASQSDLVVLNSCGVIEKTERKILRRFKELMEMGKEVIMTGCLPAISPEAVEETGVDLIAPVGDSAAVEELIRKHFPGEGKEYVGIAGRLEAPIEAIVKIATGCLGECSYCATKIARGRLKSRPIEVLLLDIKQAISDGSKEIRLTAQDTASYGRDNGSSLPELINAAVEIPGEFRIRVGMMNPLYAKVILRELVESYENEKVYKFLHLPLQSGDDPVLEHMRRGYTSAEFMEIVGRFRERFQDLTLSTDVIVGYPTEDEESFARTYEFIEGLRPDILNITRFSPRPGTQAAKLKDMPDRLKKQRSRKLTALHRRMGLEIHKKLVGMETRVLVAERGRGSTVMGRTDSYKAVVMKEGVLGEFARARITGYTFSYLIGDGTARDP